MPNHAAFNWKFHRIGGLDQVTLRTPEELLHLNELDPKLWVASCPIDKLQFDARTLELLDAATRTGASAFKRFSTPFTGLWTASAIRRCWPKAVRSWPLRKSGRIRMKAACFIPQQAVSSRKVEKRGLSRRRM
ncbi:MAG: hypothetical protein ACLRWP_16675 [Bilophila wadsworthia]